MTHTSTEQPERLRANLIDALYSSTEDVTLSAEECQHLGKIISNQHARILELEASQAQCVPLTDEQIFNIYCKSDSTLNTTSSNLTLFARAIEAAHGITQEKQGCKKEGS